MQTPQDLSDLTAEDLQLLLSGRGGAISMEELRDCISFIDSREEAVRMSAPERLVSFSENFLDALALMSDEERVRCALRLYPLSGSQLIPCLLALLAVANRRVCNWLYDTSG